ncbi:MAG: alpha/beta hydrolase [Dysgonamonadaceae bacterium]|jgi:pimeloyl-ACP methyl ester carboxylesterase|nr:alpha/beta hydrolase [Dysgonamonadaceae bacterium]
MKRFIILFFSVLYCISLFSSEENLVLHTPTGDIYGTLLLPDSAGNVPVAILIAGSGPTDRNGNQPITQNNSLKYLAEGLAQHQIASLRFDKRAIGESKAAATKEDDLRFETYVEDVKAWIDLLSSGKRFSSLTVIGHSEGSLIGMIASENNDKVDAYISIAGVAVAADEILREQLASQPQQVKDMIFPLLEQLKQGQTIADVSPVLYSLFRPSVQPYMISWMKYNPQAEIKKLDIPVLIIQGTSDIQVAVYHADSLAAANPKSEKIIIESMNHVLKKCESMEQAAQTPTYTNPELPLAEELAPAIAKFISTAAKSCKPLSLR